MRRRALSLIAVSFSAFAVASSATAEPASVASKQAQAQSVMGQIQSLDASLEHAIEAYHAANDKLKAIRADLAQNRVELKIATGNLQRSQQALAARMVAVYTSDERDSTLDVLVGSRSLSELVEGLKAVGRARRRDPTPPCRSRRTAGGWRPGEPLWRMPREQRAEPAAARAP